ncbi:MAG: ADP-ribosylation factor-like protein [Balneolaceae bacterium]|nr:ADP-ribosylation factor-like protein [Balneolaceae bacterium]
MQVKSLRILGKIIFVGNGRVGKTSIAKRLRLGIYNKDEDSTHGIRIIPWKLKLNQETGTSSGETIALNMWDFGGQDIYHATHRFFMTYRALYVLVWDCRTEEKMEKEPEKFMPYQYWLDKIRSLSGNSPILLVQNKIDKKKCGVDKQNQLQGRIQCPGIFKCEC